MKKPKQENRIIKTPLPPRPPDDELTPNCVFSAVEYYIPEVKQVMGCCQCRLLKTIYGDVHPPVEKCPEWETVQFERRNTNPQ